MKKRYWVASLGLAIIAAIISAIVVLFETPVGLHWAVEQALQRSGGKVAIGGVQGERLAGQVTLQNVQIRTATAHLAIHRLTFKWDPWSLLSGTLKLSQLRLVGVKGKVQRASSQSHSAFKFPAQVKLPLKVSMEHFSVDNLTISSGGHNYRLNQLSLRFQANSNQIAIRRLTAYGPKFAVKGRVLVVPYNRWQTRVHLDWSLRLPGRPRVQGVSELRGALMGQLHVMQQLRADGEVHFDGTVTQALKHPSWKGRLQLRQLDLHFWLASWPSSTLTATILTQGSLRDFRIRGPLRLHTAKRHFSALLELRAGWTPKRLTIKALTVQLPREKARLQMHGELFTSPMMRAQASVSWRRLSWPLHGGGPSAIRLSKGTALVSGTLAKWTVKTKTSLQLGHLSSGHWDAVVTGNRDEVSIEKLDGQWLGGTIHAKGRLHLHRSRTFKLAINAQHLNPSLLTAYGLGPVRLNAQVMGALSPLQAELRVGSLRSSLNRKPISGRLQAIYRHRGLTVRSLSIAAGKDRLTASGTGSKGHLDLRWHLLLPKIDRVYRLASGALVSRGRVIGSLQNPRFQGVVTIGHLGWKRQLSVAKGRLRFDLGLAKTATTTFDAKLAGVRYGSLQVQRLIARLQGSRGQQRFSLTGNSPQGHLNLQAHGYLANGLWKGVVNTADMQLVLGPRLHLTSTPQVLLSRGIISLSRACWDSNIGAKLCIDGQTSSHGWTAHAQLKGLPLHLLNPLLAGGLRLQGRLNSTLAGQGGSGQLRLNLTGSTGKVQIARHANGQVQSLAVAGSALSATVNNQIASAKLNLQLQNAGTILAEMRLPWRTHPNPVGQVHLVAKLPDLGKFNGIFPQVRDLKGKLLANVTFSGTLKRPAMNGSIQVEQGELTVPATGTRLTNLTLSLIGHGPALDFKASSSDRQKGHLSVQGQVSQQASQWVLNAAIEGHNFHAADIPELRFAVSPQLHVLAHGRQIQINGRLEVPFARIEPPQFSQAVRPTPDLVIVGKKRKPPNPWQVATSIQIKLGNDVRFQGYGLKAQLGGTLSLNEQPGRLTTASGDINIVNGKYQAYGQDLTISRGRLLFSGGPVDNPGLDISASRTVGTVQAGLNVTGTLQSPHLQVFSDPAMSQSDALAYLLFGHGVQQTTGSQQNTLAQAANAIGIAGGTYLAKSLGRKIGIDTVSVESASQYDTSAQQSSLFLGKYLSPRLYVSYGIGLFNPINLFRARYKLSRHWAVEAESGTISGADILFNISH